MDFIVNSVILAQQEKAACKKGDFRETVNIGPLSCPLCPVGRDTRGGRLLACTVYHRESGSCLREPRTG